MVEHTLARPTLMATRRRKGREVVEDVRPVIRHMHVDDSGVIEMELQHNRAARNRTR